MNAARVVATFGALLAVSCSEGRDSTEHHRIEGPQQDHLVISESIAITLNADGPRIGLVSTQMQNATARKLTIMSVTPDQVSSELSSVRYLGWSTCKRGCAGGESGTPQGRAFARRSIDGRGAFDLAPGKVLSLVFELTVARSADPSELAKRNCAWGLRDVAVRMSNGTTRFLTGPSGYVAAFKATGDKDPRGIC